jgi:low affinity Fe/Cu permease
MPEWFDGVAQELSLIGAAPISFAVALVVVIIVVWAIPHWFYHRMLSSKDIQIEVLQVAMVKGS